MKNYYTVSARIFAKYVEQAWTSTLDEAMKEAEKLSNDGWIFRRIEHPNGLIQEVGVKDKENPIMA